MPFSRPLRAYYSVLTKWSAILISAGPKLVLLWTVATLCSCLPMGIPEHFAEVNRLIPTPRTNGGAGRAMRSEEHLVSSLYRGTAVVLIDPSQELEDEGSLGHQYLFGILPVTSLYLQHSSASLLREILIDELQLKGVATLEIDSTNASAVSASLPNFILQGTLKDFRLNAYDLFFLRRLATDGELSLTQWTIEENGLLAPKQQINRTIAKSAYSKSGFAPELLSLAHQSLQQNIRRGLSELLASDAYRGRPRLNGLTNRETDTPLVVLAAPTLQSTLPTAQLKIFGDTYGLAGVPPFTERSLLRVLQRGLANGAKERQVITAISSLSTPPHLSAFAGQTIVKVMVSSLSLGDSALEITAEIQSSEISLSGSPVSGPHRSCTARVLFSSSEVKGRDGFAIVALEEAGRILFRQFFSPVEEDSSIESGHQNVATCL